MQRKKAKLNPAWVFLTPWLIGILIFSGIPLISSLYLSFTNYSFVGFPTLVGAKNYINLFTNDTKFLDALKVTCLYVLVSTPIVLSFALLLAVMLNKKMRGIGIFRAIYYLPSLIGGSVAVAILWQYMFGESGSFNQFMAHLGFSFPSWVGTPEYALWSIIFLKIWQFGAPMVIFLSGIKNIPADLYEAASIDGASGIRQFFSITVPMLSPIIFFNTIMQIIQSFQAFTPSYIISNGTGGPVNSLLFYTLYIYQTAFGNFQMGYASAAAWILLILIAACTAAGFWVADKCVFYNE
ncbi:MAG: sugar ABC transporter permease [Clostridiales bacterium]|nr:sugar ABC transporter permease [Clostridiales bacterium]